MGIFKGAYKTSTSLLWLALPRIILGLFFLRMGIDQYANGWLEAPKFREKVLSWATDNPWLFYEQVWTPWILKHTSVLAYGLVLGQIVIGTFLVVGYLTRVTSFLLILLSSFYFIAIGHFGPNDAAFYLLSGTLGIVFLASNAGRSLGVDGKQ